mmetsp:Transcript_9641/g.27773  ORF Transcript_9641/g.27773 Transcript_9641/m.27773 type:complete len:201 (+) Transcript_9641:50-652(+)
MTPQKNFCRKKKAKKERKKALYHHVFFFFFFSNDTNNNLRRVVRRVFRRLFLARRSRVLRSASTPSSIGKKRRRFNTIKKRRRSFITKTQTKGRRRLRRWQWSRTGHVRIYRSRVFIRRGVRRRLRESIRRANRKRDRCGFGRERRYRRHRVGRHELHRRCGEFLGRERPSAKSVSEISIETHRSVCIRRRLFDTGGRAR